MQITFIIQPRINNPNVFPLHPLLSQNEATTVPSPPKNIVRSKQIKAVLSLMSQWAWGQQQYSFSGSYI